MSQAHEAAHDAMEEAARLQLENQRLQARVSQLEALRDGNAAAIEAMALTIGEQDEKNAALTRERDALTQERDELSDAMRVRKTAHQNAVEQADALRIALRSYGQHTDLCAFRYDSQECECDCGLSASLEAAGTSPQPAPCPKEKA